MKFEMTLRQTYLVVETATVEIEAPENYDSFDLKRIAEEKINEKDLWENPCTIEYHTEIDNIEEIEEDES